MLAELPDLAAPRARLLRRLPVVLVLDDLRLILRAQLEPGRVEARQPDIKAGGGQRLHLPAQHGLVGRGLCEQVVGVHERAPLDLGEPLDLDAGELRVPALPRRQDPAVAVDQISGGVDPGRNDPPKLVKAVDQAVDLLLRMQLGVAGVGDQLVDLSPDEPDGRFSHVFLSFPVGNIVAPVRDDQRSTDGPTGRRGPVALRRGKEPELPRRARRL